MARTHVHEESFAASPEALFDLLIRPSAVRAWWGAAHVVVLAETGGTWAAAWGEDEDDPDYVTVAVISEFERPSRLVLTDYRYATHDGPLPFEAEFTTTFSVAEGPAGARLRVEQAGFPEDQPEFYAACAKGWIDTFRGIRRYLESGRTAS